MNNLSKTKKGESQQSSVERRLSGDSWSGTQQQAGQVSAGGTRKRKGSKGKLKDDRPPHVIPQTVQRHKLHSQRSLGSLAPLQTNLPPTSPGHSPAPSPGMARSNPLRRTSTDGTRRPKDYPELEMSRATSLEESRHVAVATANEGADTENDQEREETDSDDDKEKRAQTNQKLAKFFGDGKVPYHDEPMAHSMGHLLRETYDLVLCTGSHEIRGATLDSLMRWLTRHDRYDPEFTKLFFLCYPNFTTAEAVADSLWERFHMQPPETLTKKEKQFVTERKLKPIQNRVLTVVGYWVDEFFYDLKEMPTVLSRLMNLILLATPWNPLEHSQTMYQMMVKMVMRQEEVQLQYAPPSDFGYLMSAEEFWRCDPSEVARQCTVIEWRLFRAIRPREFLNQAWNKIHLKDRAPHILAFIERSGNVTAWVIYSILNTPTLKERIRLLRFFIKMVWDCYELNNFSTTMALLAGLRSTAVKRLKHTWEGVMPNKRQQVEQLWEMMDAKNNYSSLRRAMQHAEGPRIPYLGVYLKDLTFIDDGYPPMLADREGYINVEKWRMVTRVIKGLRAYQEDPYKDLVPREDLIAHLLLPVQAPDIDRDCERSIQLEPKDSTPDMIP